MKYGIFTKPIHVEKIVNYLNQNTNLDYIISTNKYELYMYDFDIGISYCFPSLVDVNYPIPNKRIWYNYHPAPLPEYEGANNYSDAIRDGVWKYAVTLHRMTMNLDRGEIIKRIDFPLQSIPVSTNELGSIAHYYLFQLFKETIESLGEPVVFGTCDGLEEILK